MVDPDPLTGSAGASGAKGLRKVPAVLVSVSLLAASTVALFGDDWPQWRGPNRAGVWKETGIAERFPEGGLEVTWRVPIGSGFSGPAVSGGRVFVTDFRRNLDSPRMEGTERAVALDEETGEVLWTHAWETSYAVLMASYAIGPRATPTVDDDRVYVVGAVGQLSCLEVETGEVLWRKNFAKEYGTSIPTWGVTNAPLVDGERLITLVGAEPGGKVIAFDKRTGEEVWRALASDSEMGYAQPVIYEAGGVRQLIIWHPKALSSLDPVTGKVYWEQPWDVGAGMTVATPVRDGSRLLVSQFYRGSMMMELDAENPAARLLWMGKSRSELPGQTDGLHALITTPIFEGDYVYGVCSYGELRALNAATGERIWESAEMTRQGRWGAAFMVRNGDRYFVNNDLGDLIIARFTPEGYVEIDRTKLIEPTSSSGFGPGRRFDATVNWSHPAYANGHIVARNDKEILRASLLEGQE